MFSCTNCDAQYPKWQGRCNECGKWGTVIESQQIKATIDVTGHKSLDPSSIVEIKSVDYSKSYRFSSGLSEIDGVLGGGFVEGSLVLLGGQPGVGKSTLLLQVIDDLIKTKKSIMYVAGEESPEQIKHRAERLSLSIGDMKCITATNLDLIIGTVIKDKPSVLVIDSIQTIWTEMAEGSAGGVAQVRATTTKLLDIAKTYNITIIIVGHVTKDGAVAGPKTLEHLVDVVLYLEGERLEQTRILRSVKNRFGSSGEVGVLSMTKNGLEAVKSSATIFMKSEKNIPGTVIGAFIDGSQVFFTDVQVLIEKSVSAYPRRVVSGYDVSRLQILLAIIHKHIGVNLTGFDIYLQLSSNIKKGNSSLDASICVAILSAFYDKSVSAGGVVVGEVGLNGLLRNTSGLIKIIREATKVGFQEVIVPKSTKSLTSKTIKVSQIEYIQNIGKQFGFGQE